MNAAELLDILIALRNRGIQLERMNIAADDSDYIHRHYSYNGYQIEYDNNGNPIVFAITN